MASSKRYIYDQNRRHSDRKHSLRKRYNNIVELCLVLGVMSILIAMGMGCLYALGKGDSFIKLVPFYAIGGVLLVLTRVIIVRVTDKRKENDRFPSSSRSSSGASKSSSRSRSGAAFILVMVLIALLSAMLLQSQWLARSSHRLQERYLLDARIRASATRALHGGLTRLANDPDLQVDHLEEDWAKDLELEWPDGSAHVVRIIDLNRYFDLNNLYLETANKDIRPGTTLLMDLMTEAGHFLPVETVDAMHDWIDPDREGVREAWYYDQEKLGYVPPNDWFKSWSEVLRVAGVERDLWKPLERYGRVRRYEAGMLDMTTVIPGRRGSPHSVNLNTASLETLRGVFGPRFDEAAASVLALRAGGPIRSFDLLATRFGDPLAFESLRPYLSVDSEFFSVEVRSYLEGRSFNAQALARRDDQGQVHILRWVL